jgi:biotin carboxyl carrier protein
MTTNYKINVNDSFHFDCNQESVLQLDAVKVDENKRHILYLNKPFEAEILKSDFNQRKYTVKVNNNTYTVSIANALDQLISTMGISKTTTKHITSIKAPMPGLILEISVEVGQVIKEHDNLIILSAMKMENSFLSPRDGVIKSIAVKVGDAVEKGQLMIEFE